MLLPRACGVAMPVHSFTEHENQQTSNLNMKYSGPENTIKCSVQITGRHSQLTGNNHKQELLRPPMSTASAPDQSRYRTFLPLTNYGFARYNAVTWTKVYSNFCKTAVQHTHTVHHKTTDSQVRDKSRVRHCPLHLLNFLFAPSCRCFIGFDGVVYFFTLTKKSIRKREK